LDIKYHPMPSKETDPFENKPQPKPVSTKERYATRIGLTSIDFSSPLRYNRGSRRFGRRRSGFSRSPRTLGEGIRSSFKLNPFSSD